MSDPVATDQSVEDILNRALSQSIACLFSADAVLPFADVAFYSGNDETENQRMDEPFHTPPVKHNEFAAPSVVSSPVVEKVVAAVAPVVPEKVVKPALPATWDGHQRFNESIARLGLSLDELHRLVENDGAMSKKYGRDFSSAKRTIKSELKEYDIAFKNFHGTEPGRADKEPMRMLYNLYRKLRDSIDDHAPEPSPAEQRLEELYEAKQSIRQILQDYQAQFMTEQGRRIKYHRDIIAVEREYRQYKQIKEEIECRHDGWETWCVW